MTKTLLTVCLFLFASKSALGQGRGVSESIELFQQYCAVCHGENFEGAPQGTPLIGELRHGDTMSQVVESIGEGYASAGMPGWEDSLTTIQIRNIALYILETRANVDYRSFNHVEPLELPAAVVKSELHSFSLETIASGIDALPFSIAPLPDGRILVTEKKFGIRVVNIDGALSELISGTPRAYSDTTEPTLNGLGNERGSGWLLDIAPHPDYTENGWIYLAYSDRCEDCNVVSLETGRPVSMVKLVRGRLEDLAWVDQETIWEADIEDYSPSIDVAAGGRIAFDGAGHVFLSVGMKGPDRHTGIQDIAKPWGKTHRIREDGSIPADNPYADREGVYRSVYTYGHRSPQGLEFDYFSGELWGTEHGPRGGDEVNMLRPGLNYGWPLYSRGMNYNGTPVDHGPELGIAFELADIQQPVVDLTPSPAVSSFVIANSSRFPNWQGDFIVGSLKARSLYRIEIEGNRLVTRETLLDNVARIRDIEQGFNGEVYLLLEHSEGSQIVELIPAQ